MISLQAKLESGDSFEREAPFVVRPFQPYLGETWIGNAVAYGCYRAGQAPGRQGPSDDELLEDLQIVAQHWHLIRVYGADNDTRRILQVIRDHELPIKVVQGIWLSPETDNPIEREANIRSTMLGVELANEYRDIVIAVSVGNETRVAWSPHRMNQATVIRYIRAVRNNVAVPVTSADDHLFWNTAEGRVLADETDFVFSHLQPLWNGQTRKQAIGWLDATYREMQERYPDRQVVIGETGWPTDCNIERTQPYDHGTVLSEEVSPAAQAAFLVDVNRWLDSSQVTTFLFEVFDESWKGGGEAAPASEIEKNWGVYYEDRTPKESFREFLDRARSDRK